MAAAVCALGGDATVRLPQSRCRLIFIGFCRERFSSHALPPDRLCDSDGAETMNDTFFNCSSLALWPSCFTAIGAIAAILPIICLIIVIVGGNFLVVLAVKNEPKLRRQRQNWLIVSLALADMLVGLLVMPLTLAYEIIGEWWFGVSWLVSLFICLPPLFGWRPRREPNQCTLSNEIGYVLYSAFGSFYIPVAILVLVYARIFDITKKHCRQRLKETERADKTLAQLGRLGSCSSNGARQASRASSSMTAVSSPPQKLSVARVLSQEAAETAKQSTDCKFVSVGRPSVTQIYPSPPAEKRRNDSKRSIGMPSPLPVVDAQRSVRRQSSVGFILPATTIPAPYQDSPSSDQPTTCNQSNRSSVASVAQLDQRNNMVIVQKLSFDVTERSQMLAEGLAKRPSAARASIPQHMNERRRRLKAKERQATLLLGLILTAFIASWLPFFAMYVLGAIGYSAPELFFKVFFWLGYCNSGINPIIYTLFNREFKRALCKQLTRRKSSRFQCLPFR
uniref:G-protein coupled receptors family 1 profile domain-containing protein n=1 Tax=Plectus sambesii TaxID=2011161 RepID=A0A914VQR2_9BILA